jgi:S-disulfanyl-L-cysteine oxidoreductase SoxD
MKSASLLLTGLWMLAVAHAMAGAGQASVKRSVWSGVYSQEQAKRGEPLYAQSCSSCHGTTLEGGEMAPPLAGGTFNSNWNDLSLGDIVERIRITMPASSPGSLSRPQAIDILAFMLGVGGFPAGKEELPRELETLKQISFEAFKP